MLSKQAQQQNITPHTHGHTHTLSTHLLLRTEVPYSRERERERAASQPQTGRIPTVKQQKQGKVRDEVLKLESSSKGIRFRFLDNSILNMNDDAEYDMRKGFL